MNALALKLGLSPALKFHDVYSLTDTTLLSLIPRPVHGLLVILPLTPAWHASRIAEDEAGDVYKEEGDGKGESGVLWFKQTIGHACGSIGLLHCVVNGSAKEFIEPGSTFDKLRKEARGLGIEERAKVLYDSQAFEDAHQSVAEMGDTAAPSAEDGDKLGQHFVAFVKQDGRLWELEGSRKGPICRGTLGEGEDVLSERGVELGLGRVIEMEKKAGGGDLRFSCIALAGGEE